MRSSRRVLVTAVPFEMQTQAHAVTFCADTMRDFRMDALAAGIATLDNAAIAEHEKQLSEAQV